MDSPIEAAFDELVRTIASSAQFIREHPFYAEPENRAAGYAFLTSMLLSRIEEDIVFDPEHPYFRILDMRIREGGDNPDQRYLISTINGGDTYRIWGRRGSACRVDLQIYSGDPYIPGSGGRAASFLNFEQISFADDGSFEVLASPTRRDANWIENPGDATRILARQVFSEWSTDDPGEMHIDRAGHEGSRKPVLTEDAMAGRLRKASANLESHVRVWPEMVEKRYLGNLSPNVLSVPFDPGALGGVPGRYMCHGTWDLADDEALVIRTWPARGNYQGIQLADLWFSSLEYANRQTSLTADQAELGSDGSFSFVLAAHDPGVANWLDTTGRRRGVILLRYDGMTDAFDPNEYPTATKVAMADVSTHLPSGTPTVSPERRQAVIASRRRHVQVRFGN